MSSANILGKKKHLFNFAFSNFNNNSKFRVCRINIVLLLLFFVFAFISIRLHAKHITTQTERKTGWRHMALSFPLFFLLFVFFAHGLCTLALLRQLVFHASCWKLNNNRLLMFVCYLIELTFTNVLASHVPRFYSLCSFGFELPWVEQHFSVCYWKTQSMKLTSKKWKWKLRWNKKLNSIRRNQTGFNFSLAFWEQSSVHKFEFSFVNFVSRWKVCVESDDVSQLMDHYKFCLCLQCKRAL